MYYRMNELFNSDIQKNSIAIRIEGSNEFRAVDIDFLNNPNTDACYHEIIPDEFGQFTYASQTVLNARRIFIDIDAPAELVLGELADMERQIIYDIQYEFARRYPNAVVKIFGSSKLGCKISLHFVIHGIYVSNRMQNKFLVSQIAKDHPAWERFVDYGVYTKNHSLRTLWSSKNGRRKIPLFEYYNLEQVMLDSLVTGPIPSDWTCVDQQIGLLGSPTKAAGTLEEEERILQMINAAEYNDARQNNTTTTPNAYSRYSKGKHGNSTIHRFRRLKPSFCAICHREHSGENVYVIESSSHYKLGCFRMKNDLEFSGNSAKRTLLVIGALPQEVKDTKAEQKQIDISVTQMSLNIATYHNKIEVQEIDLPYGNDCTTVSTTDSQMACTTVSHVALNVATYHNRVDIQEIDLPYGPTEVPKIVYPIKISKSSKSAVTKQISLDTAAYHNKIEVQEIDLPY